MAGNMRYQALRITALIVGCLGIATSGSVFAFNAYANALKKTFNYTQTEVELLASLSNFGVSIGFPAGYMVERLGSRWTSFTALLLTSLGSFFLYSTTYQKSFYSDNSWLMDIYFFVIGFGAIFTYMASMMTNIKNFNPKHRGKVIGILDASFSSGPTFVALIYGTMFTNGHIHNDEDKQNLRGFYLMMALLFATTNLLAIVFLSQYPWDEQDTLISGDKDDKDESENAKSKSKEAKMNPEPVEEMTGFKLLKSFDYQFLMWAFIICSSLQLMVQNNITTYLKSFHTEGASTLLTTLTFAAGTVSKIAIGYLSDVVVHKVPRPAVALAAMIIQTASLTSCVFYGNIYSVLFTAMLFVGLTNGSPWCLTPTMTSEFFGVKYFGRNWGFMMLGTAFGGLILQKIFGAIYEDQIVTPGVKDCYGLECFQYSFVLVAGLSLCTVILYAGLLERRLQLRKFVKNDEQLQEVSAEINETVQH